MESCWAVFQFILTLIDYFYGICRSPLKIFIGVCICCLFSTIIAGSGLYKGTSEDKFSSLKNTQDHNYDVIFASDMEQEEEEEREGGCSGNDSKYTPSLSWKDKSDVVVDEGIQNRGKEEESTEADSSWLRELFPNSATLFLCAVGFLASYGEGGKLWRLFESMWGFE